MPTRNRRAFVGQAVWYFLRQDYPNKELIVLDDGEDSIADLIPSDEQFRYVRLDRRHAIGAKRNLGCEMSRGDLIAHWDDDDWMAPDRLSRQVRELLRSGADVCGTRELLHYALDAGQAWLYRPLDGDHPPLAGGTLLYRREAWVRTPFPAIDIGEDTEFILRQPVDRTCAVVDPSLYVALIHRGNTGSKRLTDPRWERRPFEEVSCLLAADRDFYVGLRHGPRALQTAESREVEAVTVAADFLVYDGYGSMSEFLAVGMERAGAAIDAVPFHVDLEGASDELREILRRPRRASPRGPVLYFSWPKPDLQQFAKSRDLFVYTMWESSRLPVGWAERLNQTRAILVPTRYVARVCRESGVTVPIEVVPLGIDPGIYRFVDRPERPSFTTLVVGTVIGRKHVREAIAGWKLAFAGDPDAKLLIKSRFHYGNYAPDDPRITLVDDNEKTRGIAHWYERADVLVAVGNEGFGLPLVEAMATGLPTIALNSEGQADTCEDAGEARLLPIAPTHWEQYDEPEFGRCGVRGVPSPGDIADRLRWVAEHRQEARAMGRAAADWVHLRRNVWKTGPAALDVMERHSNPARPLRNLPAFWVPSWQTPCGIAEYTAHLSEELPNVRVTSRMPDARGTRLLHIQHETSLFDDSALTESVQRARAGRMPVVITEHTVGWNVRPWERDANVLTALTQRGAAMLRARWPDKRVEYLPHGCPTWFPPRKKASGLTIGAFGFLEYHKGFWQLLDLVRALPGTELLLVSHSKNHEKNEQWARDAAGLPVRHCSDFMPVEAAARLLAAEADILVYWYDELGEHASASGAVRVGMATGVPVLASATNWFKDLEGPTYQSADLIEGARRLLDDTALREETTSAARDYCHQHSWTNIAKRHVALWQSLDPVN